MSLVEIRYMRPPDRSSIFRQRLVHQDEHCIITLMERTPLAAPAHVGERIILEPDSPVVWFTFPGEWHDVGRFHTAAGAFTGCYANLLTPVRFLAPLVWETTDLFLDVWVPQHGPARLLDEDELETALAAGWLDPDTAGQAKAEADRLLAAAADGSWPPPIVRDWPLERARAAVAGAA